MVQRALEMTGLPVVDATDVATALHMTHNYEHLGKTEQTSKVVLDFSKFDYNLMHKENADSQKNNELAGPISNWSRGRVESANWRVIRCPESACINTVCLVARERSGDKLLDTWTPPVCKEKFDLRLRNVHEQIEPEKRDKCVYIGNGPSLHAVRFGGGRGEGV